MNTAINYRRLAVITVLLVALAALAAWYLGVFAPWLRRVPANAIMVIAPYRYNATWVFDDPTVGLEQEPFVSGADAILDELVAAIPNARDGFRLLFSDSAFVGNQRSLTLRREYEGGGWYGLDGSPLEGWLCPSLFKYFSETPAKLYIRVETRRK